MRLKLRSLSLLDPQNMPNPIPHCSNFRKIIFLKKGPSKNLSTNKYLMSRPHVGLLHRNLSWFFTFIILLTRRGVTWILIFFKSGFAQSSIRRNFSKIWNNEHTKKVINSPKETKTQWKTKFFWQCFGKMSEFLNFYFSDGEAVKT